MTSWMRGMMVHKRITSKKTATGYSIYVYFKDGKHVKPIIACLDRYFEYVADMEQPGRVKQTLLEADLKIEALRDAKILK